MLNAAIISMFMLFLLGFSVSCPAKHKEASNRYYLYISPLGHDANIGSFSDPIRTLNRANEILMQEMPDKEVVIRIKSDCGEYLNDTVEWYYYDREHRTIFQAYPEDRNAVFAADNENPPFEGFFSFYAQQGEPTNLVFSRITITGYPGRAILFKGDRENEPAGWNGFNVIENCVFKMTGNYWFPDRFVAYSVIGLTNSRNNIIRNCEFIKAANTFPDQSFSVDIDSCLIKNTPDIGPNLVVIGIYLAHHCHSNEIVDNSFSQIAGDIIRIRDNSNRNIVSGNISIQSGYHGFVTAWHCLFGCTKSSLERSSYENYVGHNVIYGNYDCSSDSLNVYIDLQPLESDSKTKVTLIGNLVRGCPDDELGKRSEVKYK